MKKNMSLSILISLFSLFMCINCVRAETLNCEYKAYKIENDEKDYTDYKLTLEFDTDSGELKNCISTRKKGNNYEGYKKSSSCWEGNLDNNNIKTDSMGTNPFYSMRGEEIYKKILENRKQVASEKKCPDYVKLDILTKRFAFGDGDLMEVFYATNNKTIIDEINDHYLYKKDTYDNPSVWLRKFDFKLTSSSGSDIIINDPKDDANSPTDDVKLYKTVTCGNSELPENLVKLISIAITAIQIVTPLILIVTGMLDFFKATTSSNEDGIKKAQQTFARRLIAGAAVFFIILAVKIVVGLVNTEDSKSTISCLNKLLNYKTSDEVHMENLNKKADECAELYNNNGKYKRCLCELFQMVSKGNYKETGKFLDSELPDAIKKYPQLRTELEENYENSTSSTCYGIGN
jgi:hypothetical protein